VSESEHLREALLDLERARLREQQRRQETSSLQAGMAALIKPNTKVVYTESPGSHTFELQDIPAIARAAHARGAKVLMDNTWGIHTFMPFQHGVDVSIQALTKYVSGHSDILLGSVCVNSEEDWQIVRSTASLLGQFASPDDVYLALRGVRTMPLRLKHQFASSLEVARWFEAQPQVLRVLHPGLPSHPQHALFARDFTGGCSLFSVVFQPRYAIEDVFKFINALEFFGIGASWGGYESLALPTTGFVTRTAGTGDFGGPMARIHIGLEDVGDLCADLAQGLSKMG
jgi:cystathionine beta-lyase